MLQIASRLVKWNHPPLPPYFVKLNSNGSCQEGNCEAGGIIRDSEGNFILAYSSFWGGLAVVIGLRVKVC